MKEKRREGKKGRRKEEERKCL